MRLTGTTYLLGVAALAVVATIATHWPPPLSTDPPASAGSFKADTCFVHNGKLEPWEPYVDGMVLQVGYEQYLIAWRGEWVSRYDMKKAFGVGVQKSWLEAGYHEAPCPKAWQGRTK